MAVNLSPVNPPRKTGRFVTDLYGKFDGKPLRAAARSVKFNLIVSQKRIRNLTDQTARKANQTLANLTRSERFEADVKFSFKFNQKALK